jgi:hypothetical protein
MFELYLVMCRSTRRVDRAAASPKARKVSVQVGKPMQDICGGRLAANFNDEHAVDLCCV